MVTDRREPEWCVAFVDTLQPRRPAAKGPMEWIGATPHDDHGPNSRGELWLLPGVSCDLRRVEKKEACL